jgi:hypothetical protein
MGGVWSALARLPHSASLYFGGPSPPNPPGRLYGFGIAVARALPISSLGAASFGGVLVWAAASLFYLVALGVIVLGSLRSGLRVVAVGWFVASTLGLLCGATALWALRAPLSGAGIAGAPCSAGCLSTWWVAICAMDSAAVSAPGREEPRLAPTENPRRVSATEVWLECPHRRSAWAKPHHMWTGVASDGEKQSAKPAVPVHM